MKATVLFVLILVWSNLISQTKQTDLKNIKVSSKDRVSYMVSFDDEQTDLNLLGTKYFKLNPVKTYSFKIEYQGSTIFQQNIIPSNKDLLEITIDLVNKGEVIVEYKSERDERIANEHEHYLSQLQDQFILIKGGSFNSTNDSLNDTQIESFYLSKFETTQYLWEIIMKKRSGYYVGNNRPVESVSWLSVQEFIEKLNARTGLKFRLPTSEEWEYAAKGGPNNPDSLFAQNLPVDQVCWNNTNCKTISNPKGATHFVGSKKPNSIGLYDMNGNVWEWCDGPVSNTNQIIRGGSISTSPNYCSNEYKNNYSPKVGTYFIGFRLALDK